MKEVLANIGFDWQVALSNFVTFLIIFFILKKYVFSPMGNILEERKKKIEEGLAKSEQSREELLHARKKVQEELAEAKAEANRIIAEAQEKSDRIVAEAEERARERIREEERRMKERIEQEVREAEARVKQNAARLVTKAVERILMEDLSEEQDRAYRLKVEKILAESGREA